ncbi:MAG: hypothetical protein CMJ58_09595 [Planctomycetaceae bacterium]|nr:hypothetical protein [Planctomycetaceae bacterium]
MVYPLADDYFDERSKHADLRAQLADAETTAAALPAEELQVAELTTQLAALEQRTMDEESVAAFRSRLIELIRASGCQIRRFDVGAATARPWTKGDHAIDDAKKPTQSAPTPFQLERRSVTLAVDGPITAIHSLLESIENEKQLAHPRRLQLSAGNRGGTTVMMELELWFFALTRLKG